MGGGGVLNQANTEHAGLVLPHHQPLEFPHHLLSLGLGEDIWGMISASSSSFSFWICSTMPHLLRQTTGRRVCYWQGKGRQGKTRQGKRQGKARKGKKLVISSSIFMRFGVRSLFLFVFFLCLSGHLHSFCAPIHLSNIYTISVTYCYMQDKKPSWYSICRVDELL